MRDRNPAEFKSITEQLMEHLQNNIEVYFLDLNFVEPFISYVVISAHTWHMLWVNKA